MKVKEISSGKIYNALRFKDIPDHIIPLITGAPEIWKGNEIFIERVNGVGEPWSYMFDEEVLILEEN